MYKVFDKVVRGVGFFIKVNGIVVVEELLEEGVIG